MGRLDLQLKGYSLTTAEILYRMPDAPSLLQTFIWQEYDRVPTLPVLNRFLKFWEKNIEGQLAGVRVAARGIISPTELKIVGKEYRLH